MDDRDRAIARACLVQVQLGMTEVRSIRDWWALLSEKNRQEFKDFGSSVDSYLRDLRGPLRCVSARPATQGEVSEATREGLL